MTTRPLGPMATLLDLADHNRQLTDHFLSGINRRLTLLLEDDIAHVTYAPGDGWVIVFSDNDCDDNQASLTNLDLDRLLGMIKEEALRELRHHSI